MKIIQWTAFVFIIAIIVVRGFWPEVFALETSSVCLLFLLAIPLLAPYLKKAKWLGAEFDFKESIQQLSSSVEASKTDKEELAELPVKKDASSPVEESRTGKREKEQAERTADYVQTFSVESARNVVDEDPSLAMAALRIELEKTLRFAYETLINPQPQTKSGIVFFADELFQHDKIDDHQRDAIRQITALCNEAIHGSRITTFEAKRVIDLTVELSDSFDYAYSINLQPNYDWEEQGVCCEWVHCIENFPLRDPHDDNSCHFFGHDCPGGAARQIECRESMDDSPRERTPTPPTAVENEQ